MTGKLVFLFEFIVRAMIYLGQLLIGFFIYAIVATLIMAVPIAIAYIIIWIFKKFGERSGTDK